MPAEKTPSNLHSDGVKAGAHVQAVHAQRASLLLRCKHFRIPVQPMCCNSECSILRSVHSSEGPMLKFEFEFEFEFDV